MGPVPCLRFTHSGIDSRMVFTHDNHEEQSVYQTLDALFRGKLQACDVTPLELVVYPAGSDHIWSLSSRRLAALRMFQSLSLSEIVWVRYVLRDSKHPKFQSSMTTSNDGLGVGLNTSGLSVAQHLGRQLFRPADLHFSDFVGPSVAMGK